MIEVFYYIGLFCLAICIKDLFYFKEIKEDNKKQKEALNEGFEAGLNLDMESAKKAVSKEIKKMKPLNFICFLIINFWIITGIIISQQKILFILLLCVIHVSSNIVTFIIKDENKRVFCSYIDNIICFLLVSVIIYNHFFSGVV